MKKYMENNDSSYIWVVGLGKIPSSSPYLWEGGFAIFMFKGIPEIRHETCQNSRSGDESRTDFSYIEILKNFAFCSSK